MELTLRSLPLISSELRDKIEERFEKAKKKDIFGKAHTIVRELGKDLNADDADGPDAGSLFVHGTITIFQKKEGSAHNIRITIMSCHVFTAEKGELANYIPGVWEQDFEELFRTAQEKERQARQAIAERNRARQKKVDDTEAANWGLS